MIAFDTDVLSDLFARKPAYVVRAAVIPTAEQAVPLVVAEEVVRGQLDAIRQAESGRGKITLVQAYHWFEVAILNLRLSRLLPYNDAADVLFRQWRQQKLRVSSHDLRIAAIAVAHDATLVTRNARHFGLVPGLKLDVWT